MSRIGKKPVPITSGVKIALQDRLLKFEGPKGKLELNVHPAIDVKQDNDKKEMLVTRRDDEKQSKALHGLFRSLIANYIEGVAKGYKKALEFQGVGYKAEIKGKNLVLAVGFANTISLALPQNLEVQVDGLKIHISGADKQAVGQFASDVRRVRK